MSRAFFAIIAAAALTAVVSGDTLAIPAAAYGLVPRDSGLDPSKLIELPPGCKQLQPCANEYVVRWLQCSTLTTWCTTAEVYAGCTYEPQSGWFRGNVYPGGLMINAPKAWPYCQDLLTSIYSFSSDLNIQSDTVDIWAIARAHNLTLTTPLGYNQPTSLLPAWNSNAVYTTAQVQAFLTQTPRSAGRG